MRSPSENGCRGVGEVYGYDADFASIVGVDCAGGLTRLMPCLRARPERSRTWHS